MSSRDKRWLPLSVSSGRVLFPCNTIVLADGGRMGQFVIVVRGRLARRVREEAEKLGVGVD